MATLVRRTDRRTTNIWPGFVDALATLLMVIIFLLMIFVLAQFFLSEAITGRDVALRRLQDRIGELSEMLALERKGSEELRLDLGRLADELKASVARQQGLEESLRAVTSRADEATAKAERLDEALAEANRTIEADRETIAAQIGQLEKLAKDIAALEALKASLEEKVEAAGVDLAGEREISESARAQVALLNQQTEALREQLAALNESLEAAEKLAEERGVQVKALGQRLNAALAGRVQELSRYRSEFFGRLREVLGEHPDVRIVGDRFIFQSEVLFETASADLGEPGKKQLKDLADTLTAIAAGIPEDIDWILQVQGHTDTVPIYNWKFRSNWGLSVARAISVVRHLIEVGVPPNRLSAAGFGQYQPIDDRDDEIAHRRNRRIELKLTQR